MPELPEVETMKKALHANLALQTINSIEVRETRFRLPANKPEIEFLGQNSHCAQVRRRGKYIICELSKEGKEFFVVFHAGMSGSFAIMEPSQELKKHDHIIINTENFKIAFNDPRRFGFCVALTSLQDFKPLNSLGFEPDDTLINHLSALFKQFRGKNLNIKTTLLDQSIIAGIGNIYASEILFRAKVNPLIPAKNISHAQLQKIIVSTVEVLKEAINAGGSTIRDHKQIDGAIGNFQNSFFVYGRDNQPCLKCSSIVQKIVQNQRSTFFCNSCQKEK